MSDNTGVRARPLKSAGSQVAVIGKAAAVLDAMLEHPAGMTPTELAEALGFNVSTTFRLIVSLEASGLVDRDPRTGRYGLGFKLIRYGEVVKQGNALIRRAEPVMEQLRDDTGESVYLAVRTGWEVLCLHRLPGADVEVTAWQPGQRVPAHLGAAPLALLSALRDDEVDAYLARDEVRLLRSGPVSDEQLREVVDETRRRGWSVNMEGMTEGVASMGVAVVGSDGAPVCALSLAGLASHYVGANAEALGDRLLQAADDLSVALGLDPTTRTGPA